MTSEQEQTINQIKAELKALRKQNIINLCQFFYNRGVRYSESEQAGDPDMSLLFLNVLAEFEGQINSLA